MMTRLMMGVAAATKVSLGRSSLIRFVKTDNALGLMEWISIRFRWRVGRCWCLDYFWCTIYVGDYATMQKGHISYVLQWTITDYYRTYKDGMQGPYGDKLNQQGGSQWNVCHSFCVAFLPCPFRNMTSEHHKHPWDQ
eukprot:scaffold44192_cov55-Cyclotella_meneghiniana.AAC.3